jgi:cytochrome P450
VEHRLKDVFGPDADDFIPERWLEQDASKLSEMNSHWMPVCCSLTLTGSHFASNLILSQFGSGSRTCIGRHISILEISKLVPRLVRDFDFELAGGLEDPRKRWDTAHFWFVKPKGFMVWIKPRQVPPSES